MNIPPKDLTEIIGGPAIEESDESKHWYLNGKIHRIDGPYMPTEAINWLDKYKLKHKLVQI